MKTIDRGNFSYEISRSGGCVNCMPHPQTGGVTPSKYNKIGTFHVLNNDGVATRYEFTDNGRYVNAEFTPWINDEDFRFDYPIMFNPVHYKPMKCDSCRASICKTTREDPSMDLDPFSTNELLQIQKGTGFNKHKSIGSDVVIAVTKDGLAPLNMRDKSIELNGHMYYKGLNFTAFDNDLVAIYELY